MSNGTNTNLFADVPLMTMRVPHDSGQTWGPERAVFNTDDLAPLVTTEWPPCQCWRCAGRGRGSNR
jgi:hypothetical protein